MTVEERILEYAKVRPEFRVSDCTRALRDIRSRTVAVVLCQMASKGTLARNGRGIYRLPAEGKLDTETVIQVLVWVLDKMETYPDDLHLVESMVRSRLTFLKSKE